MLKLNTFKYDGAEYFTLNEGVTDTMDFYVGFRFIDEHFVELCEVAEYIFDDQRERDVRKYKIGRSLLETVHLYHRMDKELGIKPGS